MQRGLMTAVAAVMAWMISTLPSVHSTAPENWTDILGAFSQEQKQIIT